MAINCWHSFSITAKIVENGNNIDLQSTIKWFFKWIYSNPFSHCDDILHFVCTLMELVCNAICCYVYKPDLGRC